MTWRSQRDESKFSYAEKLAWEAMMPYQYLPITVLDKRNVNTLLVFLEKYFTEEELKIAWDRKNKK
jgi:hypothetical protein